MPALRPNNTVENARSRAADYEASLEPTRRKRLGQFFSGLSLGRLLASIALDTDASTVIDPMAGHGDLLDAAIERASRRGSSLTRVQGVEIDHPTADMCARRLEGWHRVIGADAIAITLVTRSILTRPLTTRRTDTISSLQIRPMFGIRLRRRLIRVTLNAPLMRSAAICVYSSAGVLNVPNGRSGRP